MSGTNPRLPVVRREPPPDAFDVEVSLCVRVWDGPHGEYHRFEFIATRQRNAGLSLDEAGRRPDVANAYRLRDTPNAAIDAADEVVEDARAFLVRAYGSTLA